jgi:hypothetical protein
MVNGKYISLYSIIDGVFRDNGYDTEVDLENMLEWTWEAIALIGAAPQYVEETVCLAVNDYKAKLPCNLHKIKTVLYKGESYPLPMKYDSSSLHHTHCTSCKDHKCNSIHTYKLNDNYILTSFEEGDILMTMLTFPVDDKEFPMIPDNVSHIKAVKAYLTYMIDYRLWRQNRIADPVFKRSESEWLWYVGKAKNQANMPNIDRMESLKEQWLRLIPRIREHDYHFSNLNNPERRLNKNSL